jgi:hypothetical protein
MGFASSRAADAQPARLRKAVRSLIVAVCVGSAAALGGLLVGLCQPGNWVAEATGRPARGFDIFIHDHYLIVKPAILLVNFVAYAILAYALVWLWRRRSRSQDRGAGA